MPASVVQPGDRPAHLGPAAQGRWYARSVVRAEAIDAWLIRSRRGILMAYDSGVWALVIALFVGLRYLDIASGFPGWQTAVTIVLAAGLQLAIGSALGIYQGRYRIGSKDEAIAIAASTVSTSLALLIISLVYPGGRLIAVSVPIGAGALAALTVIGAGLVRFPVAADEAVLVEQDVTARVAARTAKAPRARATHTARTMPGRAALPHALASNSG